MYFLFICLCHPLPLESNIWSNIIYNHVFSFPSGLCNCVFLTSTDAPCCWAVLGQSRFSWPYLSWRWVRTANLRTPLGSSCPSKVREHFCLAFSWFASGFLLGVAAPFVWPVVWWNRVNLLEYTFLTCYLLVFMTEFDELINVLGSVGNSQRRQILQFNHTPNECVPNGFPVKRLRFFSASGVHFHSVSE